MLGHQLGAGQQAQAGLQAVLVFGAQGQAVQGAAGAVLQQGAVAGGVAGMAEFGLQQPGTGPAHGGAVQAPQGIFGLRTAGTGGLHGLVAPAAQVNAPLRRLRCAGAGPLCGQACVAPRQQGVALQAALLGLAAQAPLAGAALGGVGLPLPSGGGGQAAVTGVAAGVEQSGAGVDVVTGALPGAGAFRTAGMAAFGQGFELAGAGFGHALALALQQAQADVPAGAVGLDTGVVQPGVGPLVGAGPGQVAAVERQVDHFTRKGERQAAEVGRTQQVVVVAHAQPGIQARLLQAGGAGLGPTRARGHQAGALGFGQVGTGQQAANELQGRRGVAAASQGNGVVHLRSGGVGVEQKGAFEVFGGFQVALFGVV